MPNNPQHVQTVMQFEDKKTEALELLAQITDKVKIKGLDNNINWGSVGCLTKLIKTLTLIDQHLQS